MRSPAFWWRAEPSPLARLLTPASALYGAVAGRRMGRGGERAAVPVVCVGNFTAGGAGKTPTALRLAALLRSAGESPVFLTRGYGGRLAGPLRVEAQHEPDEVGDEPLLLARTAPTIVSRDRPAGARLAARLGASVIVMDDGLQNPSLAKDLSIAVVDGAAGFGNRMPLPAGPLRAPLAVQWARADAVLIIGEGAAGRAVAEEARALGTPVWHGRLNPTADAAARLEGRRVLAFAGIGRPEKAFETIRDCGAEVVATRAFPDHYAFSAADLAALRAEAGRRKLTLVTTEKDLVRLRGADDVLALPVALDVEDEEGLRALVLARLSRRA
jgi:tetraacyldisaccharide 4'-kinase